MLSFDFHKYYTLEDERVLLRPLQASDMTNLLPFALQEPDLWHYSFMPVTGAESLHVYIEKALTAKQERKDYPFIVFDKQANAYAGSTRFYDIDMTHQNVELGYTWYGKAFQGTGLNVHCKYLMLSFAFEQMGAMRVGFRADVNNARSIQAMKNIGCVEEGVMRSHLFKSDGGRRDSILLSILQNEWEQDVKTRLQARL